MTGGPDHPASAARALDLVALGLQGGHHALDVIALDLDHPILDRAARAASGLELLAQHDERAGVQQHAFDHGHRLATATLGFARHAHRAIALRHGLLTAGALGHRLPAARAHAAQLGGIHQTTAGELVFHGPAS